MIKKFHRIYQFGFQFDFVTSIRSFIHNGYAMHFRITIFIKVWSSIWEEILQSRTGSVNVLVRLLAGSLTIRKTIQLIEQYTFWQVSATTLPSQNNTAHTTIHLGQAKSTILPSQNNTSFKIYHTNIPKHFTRFTCDQFSLFTNANKKVNLHA